MRIGTIIRTKNDSPASPTRPVARIFRKLEEEGKKHLLHKQQKRELRLNAKQLKKARKEKFKDAKATFYGQTETHPIRCASDIIQKLESDGRCHMYKRTVKKELKHYMKQEPQDAHESHRVENDRKAPRRSSLSVVETNRDKDKSDKVQCKRRNSISFVETIHKLEESGKQYERQHRAMKEKMQKDAIVCKRAVARAA